MAPEPVVSRRALLEGVAATLRSGRVPEPRREALRLWSEVSGLGSGEAVLHPGAPVLPELAEALGSAATRRAGGEPLAHVVGRAGFRRLVLRSDRRALIPRPETEGLVDLLLARVRSGRVADVGTGTGALALSLADEGGFEAVLGVDVAGGAIELAGENRAALGLPVDLVRGDLCAPLGPGRFDAVVSNPPYLSADEYAALDDAVRNWEPEPALVGGRTGTEATARLLVEAREVLKPEGWLALEVDSARAAECAGAAAALGWCDIAILPDLFGRDRYLLARRSATT